MSPVGGMITRWQVGTSDVFFPYGNTETASLEVKPRGGMFACAPNFGSAAPGVAQFGLPQHGPLRDTPWQDCRFVGAIDTPDEPPFSTLYSRTRLRASGQFPWYLAVNTTILMYDKGFSHSMVVERETNQGPLNDVPVAVGIHPYFNLPLGGFAVIEGTQVEFPLPKFGSQVYAVPSGLVKIVLMELGVVTLKLRGYTHVVVWSDNSRRYACVEPVLGDPEWFGTSEGHFLKLGNRLVLDCTFEFTPI